MESSRPLATLTMYHFLLSSTAAAGASASGTAAPSSGRAPSPGGCSCTAALAVGLSGSGWDSSGISVTRTIAACKRKIANGRLESQQFLDRDLQPAITL